MKRLKIMLCAVLALIMSTAFFAGCKVKRDWDLQIAVRLGEYGRVWIDRAAAKFEEEFGVKVKVSAETNLASLIPNRLENGEGDDLFFCDGISWESKAVQGQLTNLDDLYKMEVEKGVTFEQRVNPEFLNTAKFKVKGKESYWKVPWTNGAGGLIYNKKMFDKNGWSVPTVYSNPDNTSCDPEVGAVGLVELCEKIYAAKVPVNPNNTKPDAPRILPFMWSQEQYYWDYVVFDWWMQLAGEEEMNNYKKADSSDLFNANTYPAQKKALQAWDDLVGSHREYSPTNANSKLYTAAQIEFVKGHAAMIPCAQWLEMGMLGKYDEEVCEMVLMPTPFMADAKVDAEKKPIRVNYSVGAGDSILIPKNAKNPDLAKKFLLFLARKENIKDFTANTHGVMLAMDYTGVEPDENASLFEKSVYEINTNSYKFNLYSQAPMVLGNKISLDWPVEGVQHYSLLYGDKDNKESVDAIFTKVHQTISDKWAGWLKEL